MSNSGVDLERIRGLLTLDRFPQSAKYDAEWVVEHALGLTRSG